MELITRFEAANFENAPLFIFVHGKAGNLDIMRIFRRVVPENAHTLFVQAPYEDSRGGYSWWDTDREDFPIGQFEQSIRLLQETIKEGVSSEGIRPSSVTALGFSQGSGMLTNLVISGKISLSRLVILAGFVNGLKESV